LDQVVLALLGAGLELEIAADGAELRDAHLAEIGSFEVIALARGLELLLLLVLRDGGAALDGAAPPWTAIARTLVWTELGHGLGGSLRRRGPSGLESRGIDPLRRAGLGCRNHMLGRRFRQWNSADSAGNPRHRAPPAGTAIPPRRESVCSAGGRTRRRRHSCCSPGPRSRCKPSIVARRRRDRRGSPAVNRLVDRVCLVT